MIGSVPSVEKTKRSDDCAFHSSGERDSNSTTVPLKVTSVTWADVVKGASKNTYQNKRVVAGESRNKVFREITLSKQSSE